jgi:hypothetical protein
MRIPEPYSDSAYYAGYKVIRNKFRKYHPIQLLALLLDYLNHPAKDELEELKKHPWLILLLIKWIFTDECFDQPNKKNASQNDVMNLMQQMLDLRAACRLPSQYAHHSLFFRNIGFQQFIFQRRLGLHFLGRQAILFACERNKRYYNDQFASATDVSINRFINLMYVLMTRFIVPEESGAYHRDVSLAWFSPVFSQYPAEEVKHFLDSMSVDYLEIRQRLLEIDNGRRQCHEQYEHTPFLRFPLIRKGDTYLCVYPLILYRSMEHFIYDTLRELDPEGFMRRFGPTFERYVEKSLHHSGLDFATESELMATLTGDGKVVDFLVVDNNTNIFIDAKGVEISYQGKVTHSAEILLNRTKDSILKAIEQAYETNSRLLRTQSAKSTMRFRENAFIIAITYSEMYLGTGKTFYEAVARGKIKELQSKYPAEVHIPMENIYFLTIEDFDLYCEGIRSHVVGFIEGLEKAKLLDAEPVTRKFDFYLHLKSLGIETPPPYLNEVVDNFLTEMAEVFGD